MTPYLNNNDITSAGNPMGPPASTDNHEEKNRGVIVFLTLYLLLVAFFILLNAVSVINEEKSEEIIGSMRDTFRPVGDLSEIASEFSSDIGSFAQASVTLLAVADLVKKAIPLAQVENVEQGELMSITLDANALFVPERAQLKASAEDMLRRTAVATSEPPPGLRYDVQALFKRDIPLGAAAQGKPTLNTARASALAGALQARGGPEYSILIGLDPALGDVVELRFEVREESDARITFEDILENE